MENGKTTSIMDLIKPLLNQGSMSGSLDIWQLLLALAVSLLSGLYIFYIYKRTFNGVLYSRSFNLSLVLLTLVTTLIIRTISSNLTLSLGMVGALSIVRFRTAVKEAMDTVFMFWAVAVGITIGAGFYLPGIVCTAIIGIVLYIMSSFRGKGNYPYLLIVRHDPGCAGAVSEAIRHLPHKARLKSKTVTATGIELTVEIRLSGEDTSLVNEFLKIRGVTDASLVSFQGDYGA